MPLAIKPTFAYRDYPVGPSQAFPNGRIAYRPIVFARLTAGNGKFGRYPVLLDTGADVCMFPSEVARMLEVNLIALPKSLLGGVGNEANVAFHSHLNIDLGQGLRFDTPIGFSKGLDASGFGLLGQQGFFSSHNVEFRLPEGIFTIEPV